MLDPIAIHMTDLQAYTLALWILIASPVCCIWLLTRPLPQVWRG